jgi:dehydrogenase/reductase SDR family member 1
VSTVALVTGAARGVGRGVALALADTGATVHVTDRESRRRRQSPLPGTVEDTAEQVDARGGRGVAHVVDHADGASAMDPVVDAVREAHDGLDLVVANAFDGNALPFAPAPFWELDPAHWTNMIDVGLRSHYETVRAVVPLVLARRGLVVLTGYAAPDEEQVVGGHAVYDLAMAGISRLTRSMHHDLAPHGVTVLCLSPGFTATEAIVAALGDALPPGLDDVETPGRAVCALLADPDVARHGGRTLPVADVLAGSA